MSERPPYGPSHRTYSNVQPQVSAYSHSRRGGQRQVNSTDPRSQPQRYGSAVDNHSSVLSPGHSAHGTSVGNPPTRGIHLQQGHHEIHFNRENWQPPANSMTNGSSAMYVGNNCGSVNFVGVDMYAHVDATAVGVGKNDRRGRPAWYTADLNKSRGGPAAVYAFNNVAQLTFDGAEPRIETACGFVTRVQNSDGVAIPETNEREKERKLSAIWKFDPVSVEASPQTARSLAQTQDGAGTSSRRP